MKKIFLTMTVITLMICCVHAVRIHDPEGMGETPQKTIVASEELKRDSIHVPSPDEVVLSECSLANEIAVISQLVIFSELSEKEINECGQAVIYVEMRYLGCKDAPELIIGDYDVSYYDAEKNKIYFSVNENINTYQEYIHRLLHLSYHVYEYQQIGMYESLQSCSDQYDDLLVLMDAEYWTREKSSYTGCSKENESLWLEKDSEKYAMSDLWEYIDAIETYWKETNPKGVFDLMIEGEVTTL